MYFYANYLKIRYMKTKNIIITAGLLGLAYLVFKNSKQESDATTEDTSGGDGGGAGGGGGFHPIIPPLAPLNVVVPPLPPKNRAVENIPAQYEHELDILQPNPAQAQQPNPNVLAGQPRPNYTTGSGTSTGGTTSGSTTTTGSGTTGGTTSTPITNQTESGEPIGANTNTSSSSTPPPLSGASETP
jgi:hypothetical protein